MNKLLETIKKNNKDLDEWIAYKYPVKFIGQTKELDEIKSYITQSRISELEALEAMLEKQLVEPDITNSGANSPKVWMFEGYVACKKEAIKIIRDTIKELKTN